MPRFLKTILITALTLSILGTFGIASGAFNEQINYQGKLTDSSSIPVSDGNHCMEFALYTIATNGASIWSEEWDSATSYAATNSGLFSVLLGTHQSLSSIDFNQIALYLEVRYDPGCDNVYEEIFSPRKRFGAVPSAFESKQLGGKAETAFGTLSESEAVIGAWTFSDLLTVTEVPTGVLVNQGSLYINPATAAADYTLLGLAVGGVEKFRVDEDGDVAIEGDISFTGSQTISTTAGDLVLNPTGNLALSSNSITGLGTGITASGALTISTTGANNLTLTPGTGLTTTGSTFQITGGLLDVDTYADIAYSDAAIAALTVTQSGTGGIVDFKDGANSVFTVADGGNTAIANISATTGSAFSVTRNLASGSTNSAIVSFIQSNASDDQPNLSLTNAGTGNSLTIDQNGNVGTAVATDGALFVENTGNTGIGLNVYSNIGATSAAGLVYFTADNTGFDQTVLTIGQDGTGNILDIQKSGSSVFEVTQSLVKVSQPLQVNVAGDVGFSRSVEFTSTGESHIYSEGPFTIAAGDPNSSENLTLTTRTTEESPETGDVTTGAASYIIDTGQTSWVNDEFVGGRIEITAGPGLGEIKEICANAASDDDRITVCSNFTTTPTTASDYAVYRKAGDILVNISGTNLTSGGFKVLGMESTVFRIDTEGDVFIGGNGRMGSDLTVKQNISLTGGNIAVGQLSTPSAPTVAQKGTAGTQHYCYKIVAQNDNGSTAASSSTCIANGNATLSATNYNQITWTAVSGTTKYRIYGCTNAAADCTTWKLIDDGADADIVYAPTILYNDTNDAYDGADPPSINTTGGNITYPSTDGPKRSIILTAAGGIPPTANGAAQTKIDGSYHSYYVLDFDAAVDESVFWHWTMPDSYDNGTIDITYYWEAASTTNEVTWCFQAKGLAANNAEDIDSALSTAVCEVDTAQGNANDLASVTESAAASNFAAGEYVAFKVFRDADVSEAGADDDMAGDARLVKVKIEYSVNSESD